MTFSDGGKFLGEFKHELFWQGTEYDKDGNVIGTYFLGGMKEK